MFLGDVHGSDKTAISGSINVSQAGMITWATVTVGLYFHMPIVQTSDRHENHATWCPVELST
ncbi:hypothetical protein KC19_6G111500 [Ceratodon purpureus]|uniref:Uncharacterized protein n=1 Tax=Ceratodon purpureus TaxID=3225 RepID=A0A8T0HDV6_CERPU|nr:hypothetical protein KC19_6G111500 [Ceratodon purpureus]